MSRIGKKPVVVPKDLKVDWDGQLLTVSNAKDRLSFLVPDLVSLDVQSGLLTLIPKEASKAARSLWGTARARIQNLVEGLTKGFEKRLEITGVGYKAALSSGALQLSLGYSHEVVYPIPSDVSISVPKPTEIVIKGIDPQRVGQVAAEIRSFRPPEPYKLKGIKYAGEFIFKKEGKKK